MKLVASTGDRDHEVTIERTNGTYTVVVDGVERSVDAQKLEGNFYSILWEGRSYEVSVAPRQDGYLVRHGATELVVRLADPSRRNRDALAVEGGTAAVVSLMPGKVVRVLVHEGQEVEAGHGLVVVEAMKMENEITAPRAGRVGSLAVTPGQTIEGGAVLLVLE